MPRATVIRTNKIRIEVLADRTDFPTKEWERLIKALEVLDSLAKDGLLEARINEVKE